MALDPITAGLDLAKTLGDIASKFIPDRDAQIKATQEMQSKVLDAFNAANTGQLEVNKVEAANANLFVSGWRPAVGWVCASGFAWAFVVGPVFAMFMRAFKSEYALPVLDTGSLITLLLGMLGLGGMRTAEKIQGIEPPSQGTVTTKEVRKATPV